MEFYDEVDGFFNKVDYVSPPIMRYDEFKCWVNDIINNNRKVLLYGDYDPDGLNCIFIWKETFHLLKFKNFEIFRYRSRTHSLDIKAKEKAISGDYDYIIINDASSSDMDSINQLVNAGLKVIIVDHHQTRYDYKDYPENCLIINSTIENRYNKEDLVVSAGALCFILLHKVLCDYRIPCFHLSAYALFSLYADSIDMSNNLNRGIYFMATSLSPALIPVEIDAFLNSYQVLCRRFIEFHMTPKINSAFRTEHFEELNKYFLDEKRATTEGSRELVEFLTNLHKLSAEMVATASDIIYHEVHDSFVVANLNTVNAHIDIRENRLYNFTGLIANKLAERYKKSAVVYCGLKGNIKGSFRDLYGRNYLSIFQKFCKAEGHNSAFGINMQMFEIHDFLNHLRIVDKKFSIDKSLNSPILLTNYTVPPDVYILRDMSIYNEFAGNKCPLALVEITRRQDISERPSGYGGYIYRWGAYNIHSRRRIPIGTKMSIRPTVGKGMKMYVV